MPMTYVGWELHERHLSDHEAFEEVQNKFLQNNPWIDENINFAKFKNQRILEIGCGSGAASCLFAKAGASVTAIDITETSVELTKSCAEACGVQINVHQMDAEQTSLKTVWGHPLKGPLSRDKLLLS